MDASVIASVTKWSEAIYQVYALYYKIASPPISGSQ